MSKNLFRGSQEPVSIFVATSKYPGDFSLKIYNSAGEFVRVLDDRQITEPFQHTYLWDGRNRYGEMCGSGVYLIRLIEPYGVRTARVLLVR